eukprot:TRINITY_DN51017_c0_g1_i1.p1 TRINITY_DN51017_c0_g1~~TRINITY_DN51017_c0_g1_i1.p1  ORF type:complete len:287 (+),score=58.37 TRINITY_DN51017_c0_g1_i1:71-931(+)
MLLGFTTAEYGVARNVLTLHAVLTCLPASGISSTFVHLIAQVTRPSLPSLDVGLDQLANVEFEMGIQAWAFRQPERGLELFRRSAQKGHHVGEYCFRYGMYHELPPSDIKQAVRWYRRGARMNHQGSTTMLGKLQMAAGQTAQAIQVLSRTAAPALSALGGVAEAGSKRPNVLERGHGGQKGDSLAQWFLGELYMKSSKLRDAVKWWKRSAENGDSDAMLRLSQVLANVNTSWPGIPKEPMLSRHWLLAAAAHGNQAAIGQINWTGTLRPRVEQRWIEKMENFGWL